MAKTNIQKLTDVDFRISRYLDMPISAIADRVWAATILRGGKYISVKQEVANIFSTVQRLEVVIAGQTELLKQLTEQNGQAVDYDRIETAMEEVVKNGIDFKVSFPKGELE